jgi:hypothetical protein
VRYFYPILKKLIFSTAYSKNLRYKFTKIRPLEVNPIVHFRNCFAKVPEKKSLKCNVTKELSGLVDASTGTDEAKEQCKFKYRPTSHIQTNYRIDIC